MAEFFDEKVHGIVLDTSLLNDYDKRLVILTAEKGLITAFANGARRPKSPLTAVSQKFVMGHFNVYAGRNAYTLRGASIEETFEELPKDLIRMTYASYFNDLTMYFTREGLMAKDELNLLYVTYMALIQNQLPEDFIRALFEIKLLDIEGVGMVPDYLATLPRDIASCIQMALSKQIADLYSFRWVDEKTDELVETVKKYTARHCDRHFKSLDILASLM